MPGAGMTSPGDTRGADPTSGIPAGLPRVDEHDVTVAASVDVTWRALVDTLPRAFAGRFSEVFARAVGCEDTESRRTPLSPGAAFTGFHVTAFEPPEYLALAGRHRFSRYALVFRVRAASDGALLSAETSAVFPGPAGAVYRALVIGSGGHVVAVRRILSAIAHAAERRQDAVTKS